MLNLSNFFKNHFNTAEISDDNLRKFAEDHLARLNANNTVIGISALITATNTAYVNFNNAINNENTAFVQQQGKTITMNNAFQEFLTTIRQKEGIIRGNWDINTAIYQEFFPLGLTEYNNATLNNIESLMTRFINIANTHNTVLGAPFIAQFNTIKSSFVAARTAQLQNISQVENLKTLTANARTAIEKQLMSNLLFIASKNIGNTDICNDYFDQSIIRRASSNEDGTIKGKLAASEIKNVENKGISASTKFKISNTGNTLLHVNLGIDATDTQGGVDINSSDIRNLNSAELGAVGNTYLNIENKSSAEEGNYEVEIM